MGKELFRAQQFIDAIPGTGGIVTEIAKKVGCVWHTARKYIDTYPTIKAAHDDECETVLDMAETKVIEAIKDSDPQMIRYYLSTKGKRRGYTERQEITGADGGALLLRIVEQIVGDDGNADPNGPAPSGAV